MPTSLESHSTIGLGKRPKEKIRLKGVEETLFCTLLPKARDAESANPVLGDPYASRLIESCDVDLGRSTFQAVDNDRAIRWVVNRSLTFDRWCRDFLQTHKDEPVTVLYLGCGLDCRVHRIMTDKLWSNGVRWIDLDRPLVVDLRQRLIPQSPPGDYHMRTLDVTTTGWMHDIPADRPTLIMAEGLFMYLDPVRVESTIRELVEYFGAKGARSSWTPSRASTSSTPTTSSSSKASGAKWKWGTDDAREVERFHPRLRLLEHVRSADYMGKTKAFGQSQVPLFGEDAAGVAKMALASLSSSNSAFGQNARFAFSGREDESELQPTGAS
ncbi:tetracenomycin polyketide synthesis O-methyltransferase tcmP [Apiospora kogelbergensis]|uniref:tetracenomycin polyketide synthesis O-methyltransferase tcmP n=1 Tax=Apiospora kogelbergensis TaxID=1337665 RepID=UPI00312F4237